MNYSTTLFRHNFYLHISKVHDVPPSKKAKNDEVSNDDLIITDTKKDETSNGSLEKGKINSAPANTVIADYVKQYWKGKVIVNVINPCAIFAN